MLYEEEISKLEKMTLEELYDLKEAMDETIAEMTMEKMTMTVRKLKRELKKVEDRIKKLE